jgi:hypothetical protein
MLENMKEYHPTREELEAIDEALEQVARGEVASKEEIDAAFARFCLMTH